MKNNLFANENNNQSTQNNKISVHFENIKKQYMPTQIKTT
jgi:hypothetical protein